MPPIRITAKNRIAQVREQRRSDKTPAESADSIKDYVDHVADIAIRADKAGRAPDFDTPLVDNTLPADLDPETAARMASDLRAAATDSRAAGAAHPGAAAARKPTKTQHHPTPASGDSPATAT